MKLCVLGITLVLLASARPPAADQIEETYQCLRDAVEKKDPAEVKTLVAQLTPMIKEATAAPAPDAAEEKKAWGDHIAYLKSIAEYCDYALFATAVQGSPAVTVEFVSLLEQQNPSSKYLDEAYARYFVALNSTGAAAKIPAIAAKAVEHFPENPDLLSVLMETTYGKQNDRALNYATRLIAAFSKPKPAEVSAAEWDRKKAAELGRAHWMAGVIYCTAGNFAKADSELRAALPMVAGQNAMTGPALFYLGTANYQLAKMTLNKARMLEAVKFSKESSAIPGPFADQARHNAIVIQTEADRMR